MNGRIICKRLQRGDDLLIEIKKIAKEENLKAAVILSSVGCVSKLRVRDAGGINIRELNENCEIVSLNGTVSSERTHLHIAFSKEDLSVIGGHLVEGCIINTTCELIIQEIIGWKYETVNDSETGYKEIVFVKK